MLAAVGLMWVVLTLVSRDQKHPQCDEIYETLEQLAIKIKDAGYRPGLGSEIGTIPELSRRILMEDDLITRRRLLRGR
ncbi:hypothetical protein RHGRI_005573 [Rhododendron griersonianum]|uniref:Uncharacterized protein n=1 Tax=Rhododendron griersonianum TaxID=479676 RepID=A0AAV6LD74_9ERIC|nr:hypothetical protein RHGRI_005573 [Rhododendron griersonianum]